jgi:acetylornithine deacetylase/succinyl-diaminopimelate desuccinylase-like protein
MSPFLLLSLAVAAPGADAPAAAVRAKVRAWRQANEVAIVREFVDLLAIPNLASDGPNIRRNADHIVALMKRRGIQARLLDAAGGPPAVYGELKAPGATRTVLVYVHYDGQPVDPARWASEPWTPVLRDRALDDGGKEVPLGTLKAPLDPEWRLYARSTGDDKAPVVGWLAALDALRAAGVASSVNLKFFFEGEEEAGSEHMRATLVAHKDLLAADAWLLCDGPVHQTRRMQVWFGARGVTGLEITAYGPARALHSGHYGNWAPNPAVTIAHVLADLRGADGRILVDGFYDDVRPLTETEKKALAAVPPVDDELRKQFALAATEADGAPLVERIMLPALNVRGIESGRVGEKAANAIPTEAQASIDFRLVPDQTPASVRERVEAYLTKKGYTVVHDAPDLAARARTPRLLRLQWETGYPASRTSLDLPASWAVVRAVEETIGGAVIQMPTLGGSVPMHEMVEVMRVPIVGVPIANHDNNQHAANENLRLQNLWDGIEVYAGLIARLGAVWPDGR